MLIAEQIATNTSVQIGLVAGLIMVAVSASAAFTALAGRARSTESRNLEQDQRLDKHDEKISNLEAWQHREAGKAEAVQRQNTAPYDIPRDDVR